jgi:hypothetical protein
LVARHVENGEIKGIWSGRMSCVFQAGGWVVWFKLDNAWCVIGCNSNTDGAEKRRVPFKKVERRKRQEDGLQ